MKLKLKYNQIKTIITQQHCIPKFKQIQLLTIKQSTYCENDTFNNIGQTILEQKT
jgi:hypothetical protein